MLELRARRNAGVQVALLLEAVGDETRHVGGTRQLRRHAVPVDDRATQCILIDAGRGGSDGETNSADGVNRYEVVAQDDTARFEYRIHPHVFEPAQTEQMR